MATDKTEKTTTEQSSQPIFKVVSQYMSDLSAECAVPASTLQDKNHKVAFDLGINLVKAEGDNQYSLTMKVRTEGIKEDEKKTLYLIEMDYTGIFHVEHIPEADIQPLLCIDGAALLFPFVREIIMKSVYQMGHTIKMIDPINFHAMYVHIQQQQQAEAAQKAS